MSSPSMSVGPAGASVSRERFLVLPIVILILAQMGTTGDNGALSLATSALTHNLGATTSEIQLANMIYPLVGGAFMIAGGLLGTIFGWVRTFRLGALVCGVGEVVLALSPNMVVFIWVGRVLVGLGASLLVPSVLGLIPLLYSGHNRMVAFGCVGAASGLSVVRVEGRRSGACRSDVLFHELSESFIDEYVAGGSPLDKAGSYGIQDDERLVARYEGSYDNIIGLPTEELRTQLRGIGVLK